MSARTGAPDTVNRNTFYRGGVMDFKVIRPTVSGMLLLLGLWFGASAAAGQVSFGFDDAHVTVVEGDRVYRFPVAVFVSQFGTKSPGELINIPAKYSGFLVYTVAKAAKETKPSFGAVRSFQYGGLVYTDYYARSWSTMIGDKKYSWSAPAALPSAPTRAPASVENGVELPSESDSVKAVQHGDVIRYYDSSDGKLLWVSHL